MIRSGNNNNNDDDPLVAGGGIKRQDSSPLAPHLKTYTAGEDKSRLAAAAKELGLQQARRPRRQVRKKKSTTTGLMMIPSVLLDSTMEDARIRSIYTSHTDMMDHDFFLSEDEGDMIIDDGHGVTGGNLTAAVLGIIKGMVGPAILYLPHGFATAGYMAALPIMAVCTALFLYSSKCLLDSWKSQQQLDSNVEYSIQDELTPLTRDKKLLQQQLGKNVPLSYPELAYRSLGTTGESLVKTGIALMQSGVCLTYLIFVPQNLHTSMQSICDISPRIWLILMVAVQIPLSWLRDIRKLTATNLLANALILYGLLVCLGFAVRTAMQVPVNMETTTGSASEATSTQQVNEIKELVVHQDMNYSTWEALRDHILALKPIQDSWYLFIGTSVLLFEGSITLLVPLQEAVNSPEQQARFPAVYQKVILSIVGFYCFFGITNWMAYGDSVRTVLTTSLPATSLSTTVQLAYSIAVVFTFPLQNFPALEITCRTISQALSASNTDQRKNGQVQPEKFYTRRNFISSCMVCLLALVAVCTMDSLDKVVSLMGSLLGCPIAFVFPPLIHSKLVPNLPTSRLWLNRFVVGLGFCAMIMASLTTLITWD